MIKKAPGGRRKFRAEYLTLSESELCRGSGQRGGENKEEIGSALEQQKKQSPVAMLYTGIQRGIVSSRLCEFKGSSLKTGLPRGRKYAVWKIQLGLLLLSNVDSRLYNVGLIVSR